MKRATTVAVLLAFGVVFLGARAFAQSSDTPQSTPAAAEDTHADDYEAGEINVDALGRNNPESSKFEEYRDVPKGISLPYFRMFGSEGKLRFDLRGENVRQLDERYVGVLKTDFFAVTADYNAIIHRIGNNGRTFLSEQSPGVWRMSDTLQAAFQNAWESTPTANRVFTTFVVPLFQPSISEGNIVDVQVQRQRTNILVDLARNKPFTAKLNYAREQRHGSGGLSSNYLNYQTETPSVTEYLTQDVGVNAAADASWFNVRGGLHYNWFEDQMKSLVFDSPFRVTDAATGNVTLPGGTASVGGPTYGRMINPPDNEAVTGTAGAMFKLPGETRINAEGALSRWTQNDQFFPYLTNTAVFTTAGLPAYSTTSLPAQSLNGKIETSTLIFSLTSKPFNVIEFNARLRRYDLDNQTPRIAFPGYGSWDRSWSNSARINAPYGNTNTRADVSAGFDVGIFTLEGAYRHTVMDRTYRETESTTENAGSASVIFHVADRANVRGVFERASRGYDGLDLGRSEDATFVVPPTGLSANVLNRPGNLRFDQANRDTDRAGVDVDLSFGSMTTIFLQYNHNKDTYNDTAHGLQDMKYDTYTAELGISPGDAWNLTGYYTHEENGSHQINNGTSNFPAIDDFTIALTDKADTAGATAMFTLAPKRANVNLGARYQDLKGTAGFTTNPTSSYQLARAAYGGVKDIPNADNAKLTRLDASLDYIVGTKVTLTLGYWYEDYVFSDVDSVGLQNIYPGAFFLALNDGSYTANVGYVRLTYHW